METKQEKIVITDEWPCLVIMNRIEVDYTESDENSIELQYTGKRPDMYVEFSPEDPEDLHCLPSVIVTGEDTLQYREDVKVIIRHKGLVRLCCCKGGKAVLHGTIPLSESFLQLDSAVDAKDATIQSEQIEYMVSRSVMHLGGVEAESVQLSIEDSCQSSIERLNCSLIDVSLENNCSILLKGHAGEIDMDLGDGCWGDITGLTYQDSMFGYAEEGSLKQ